MALLGQEHGLKPSTPASRMCLRHTSSRIPSSFVSPGCMCVSVCVCPRARWWGEGRRPTHSPTHPGPTHFLPHVCWNAVLLPPIPPHPIPYLLPRYHQHLPLQYVLPILSHRCTLSPSAVALPHLRCMPSCLLLATSLAPLPQLPAHIPFHLSPSHYHLPLPPYDDHILLPSSIPFAPSRYHS